MTNNYKDKAPQVLRTCGGRQELAFMQQEDEIGVKKNSSGKSECFQSGKDGHWAHECLLITAKERAELRKKFGKEWHG